MAHELDFSLGYPAMAYRASDQTPWHGFGSTLADDATLEEWIIAAGLNWKVVKKGLYVQRVDNNAATFYNMLTGRVALVRDDTDDVLHIASMKYQPVQPREVVMFFDRLIKEMGFTMNTMGALMDGKRVWALAKTGKGIGLTDQDFVETYLLLATSYDGQLATTARFTSVRVVCNNTLELSYSRKDGRVVSIPHSTEFNADKVYRDLGLSESQNSFASDMDKFATRGMSKRQVIEFYIELLGLEDEEGKVKPTPTLNTLVNSYEHGPGQGLSTTKDTLWGVVNGVTYFADHIRNARSRQNRLNSAWFGDSEKLKHKAYDMAKDLVA